eukprot:gene1118-1453_t
MQQFPHITGTALLRSNLGRDTTPVRGRVITTRIRIQPRPRPSYADNWPRPPVFNGILSTVTETAGVVGPHAALSVIDPFERKRTAFLPALTTKSKDNAGLQLALLSDKLLQFLGNGFTMDAAAGLVLAHEAGGRTPLVGVPDDATLAVHHINPQETKVNWGQLPAMTFMMPDAMDSSLVFRLPKKVLRVVDQAIKVVNHPESGVPENRKSERIEDIHAQLEPLAAANSILIPKVLRIFQHAN